MAQRKRSLSELLGLGSAGVGARFLQGILSQNDKVVTTQPKDKGPSLEGATVQAPPATPPQPAEEIIQEQAQQAPPTPQAQDVGINFLDQTTTQEEQAPQLPNVNDIKSSLRKAGFQDSDQNVAEFLDNNFDSDTETVNFSGLKEADDNVFLDSIGKVVKQTIKSIPPFYILSNSGPALGMVIEGLERYEAAKVLFLQNAAKQGKELGPLASVVPGLLLGGGTVTEPLRALAKGDIKTKFPEAKLRGSDQPEMGDIFRELGIDEKIAATLGLTAEIITDIPILGGAGALARQMAAKGSAKITSTAAKETILGIKANKYVKEMLDAIAGVRPIDKVDGAVQSTIRKAVGATHRETLDAEVLASVIHNSVIKSKTVNGKVVGSVIDDEALFKITNALTEGIDGPAFQALPLAQKTVVKEARTLIDKLSSEVSDEITSVIASDPEKYRNQAVKIAKRLGLDDEESVQIPLEKLAATISENKGVYVRRYYEAFSNPKFKPDPALRKKAIDGLIADGLAKTEEEAAKSLDDLITRKRVSYIGKGGKPVTIHENSFRERSKVPVYLREFMGEIKDPRYLIMQTVRDLAETRSNLRVLNAMDKAGLFTAEKTAENVVQINAKPLSFSLVDGKYTTDEVADMIKHITRVGEVQDGLTLNIMKGLKVAKTVFNPKTHGHNFLGNIPFSILAGTSILNPKNAPHYKELFEVWNVAKKVRAGKLPNTHPKFKVFQEMVENGIVGVELPSADKLNILEEMLNNPYSVKRMSKAEKGFRESARFAAELYSFEDVFYKGAAYLKYTKGRGMKAADAVNEVYKWFPNYFEAAKIAETARNTVGGMMFLNPFTTFRAESHRILLNGFKDSQRSRLLLTGMLGSRLAWNTAALGFMGNNLNDIRAYYNSRPEAISEVLLNPASKEDLDLNTRYLDPFNTRGLFSPLMALSGATGVNPFDYLLDFTTMSPDFGYSNLAVNAIAPAVTGKGRFGQELSPTERVVALGKGVGPTSFVVDLPKILDPKEEPIERFRRGLRFIGVDVEKRNPNYIKSQVSKAMRKTVANNGDVDAMVNALNQMGFDGERIKKNAIKKVAKTKEEKGTSKRQDYIRDLLGDIGS